MKRYRIIFKRSAEKALGKLPRKAQERVRDAIDHLQEEPRPRGARQLTDADNAWRIRVGRYRVIYEIQDNILVVLVIRIAHRSKAYKK